MEILRNIALPTFLVSAIAMPLSAQSHDFSSMRIDNSGQAKQNWYWSQQRGHSHGHGHDNGDDSEDLDLEVTYTPVDALDNDYVTESGELIQEIVPDREIDRLHAASEYQTIPLERHLLPPYYYPPAMNTVEDYVTTKDEFVNINPAPGEWVRIMEGKRHGFQSTTVGITYTQQGGGAPLHTHESEETHVLVDGGKVRYQLGNEVFEVQAPYVINIPPMVPHAFMNLREEPVEIVVFFPYNKWEADFVQHDDVVNFFTLP
ncbi:cupin domain-containing protein [Alcanivorax sediminis]|uniref:Cupin domain-containing protein n=1 Tax=Alcanivorax sediminis TaxID=2663008 RepID=A0A6N7LUG6_9GAMM|nr:cupin domain-containing protein [Alcanivorax sediminis]MQX53006.1 cupin domain-containing protein [Alcanivorax sediminis]